MGEACPACCRNQQAVAGPQSLEADAKAGMEGMEEIRVAQANRAVAVEVQLTGFHIQDVGEESLEELGVARVEKMVFPRLSSGFRPAL